MVYLYYLKQQDRVMYVGLTISPSDREQKHRKKKPPHCFEIIESFESKKDAAIAERDHIKKHDTVKNGWNISPGGEYAKFSGYYRKGIGGQKKGCIPWNKGRAGCFSKQSIEKMSQVRKGRVFSSKIKPDKLKELKELYTSKPDIPEANTKSANGKILTYERAFSKKYASQYNVTPENIYRIIKNV